MKESIQLLRKHKQYKEIIRQLSSGNGCCVTGLWGSSANLFAAAVASEHFYTKGLTPKILLVVPDAEDAREDWEDLKTFSNLPVTLFPAVEDIFNNESDAYEDIMAQRLFILNQLCRKNKDAPHQTDVIVSPIQALIQPVPSKKTIGDNIVSFQKGQEYPMENLIGLLHSHHYQETSQVENQGEYAIRGGIIDVFPFATEIPCRIEYFGDEIESVRSFNVETQQSVAQINSCQILFVHKMYDLHPMQAEIQKTSLLDYLSRETTIILKEPTGIESKLRQMLEITDCKETLFTEEEIFKQLNTFTKITLSRLPFTTENNAYAFQVKAIDDFPRQIQDIVAEFKKITEAHDKTIVFCINPAEEQRFREITSGLPEGLQQFELRRGYISQGFRFADINIAILANHEIFHRYKQHHEVKKVVQTRAIDSFLDLKKGDYIVHVTHGIGRFLGIEIIEDDGCKREYLVLEYDEGTKIYVPATKIELVQKYIGASGHKAKLDKIHSKSWEMRKKRAEHAVADIASDLLHIQASRNAKEGIAYPPDTEWQRDFESAFIYEETPDQLQVLEAIKSDMQSKRPMDRLICGDVGYGKTELAIRAVFKAAMYGKQAAVLVPTTILAQQHYTTFSERMADYPVEIEVLSRLKSHKEQKDILEKTLAGKIDILIGTHRLLQKDVVFKDLGLVIIDEEQRFGVAHKERFKKMRQVVDMLTLTATPIPRTLHMSLMGIKDISSLNTPPLGRQSIRTQIMRFDPQRIRQAILLEMNRNGQVYFVHNRVYNIERIAHTLSTIVPEARILVVHGQMMDEKLLAQRMKDFVDHKADILVSTTIIESGLDIPNVNTIFINCADSFGLADLHQLRGRVGRYKHHAYAYIVLPIDRPVTPEAEKRVKAIEEFAELGAGFKIAMRDLEIRGAGNILGVEQHGHIAAVGYEMYCRLLEIAVCKARNEPVSEPPDVSLKLNLESFIPDEYIPEYSLKMDIYRRLNRSNTFKEIDAIRKEMIDRFGNAPQSVKNLLSESELRIIARDSKIRSIVRVNNTLIIQVNDLKKAEICLSKLKKNIRVINNDTLHLRLLKDRMHPEDLVHYLKKSLVDTDTGKYS